jgi:hypothetical protein
VLPPARSVWRPRASRAASSPTLSWRYSSTCGGQAGATLDLPEAAISAPELDLEAAVAAQAAVILVLRVVIAGLQARVAELDRQLGRN